MRLLLVLALVVGGAFTQTCYNPGDLQFSTGNKKLLVNGQPLVLKGISYFGDETETFAPHGMWSYSLDSFLDIIKNNNFNAIRIPFALTLIRDNPTNPNVNCQTNSDICHLSALDLLDVVIDRAADRGLLIMLDYHRMAYNGDITELWYDNGDWTEANVIATWKTLLDRVKNKWNVFALDLKNEPHGQATWGYQVDSTDWNSAAERFIKALAPQFNGLFFVEGVEANAATPNTQQVAHFWGGNLEGVTWHPIDTGDANLNKRVVYSPHVYGPSVYNQPYFQTGAFPNNMPDIWRQQWGYVPNFNGAPIVIGEWGGHYDAGSTDETWANALSDYLVANCMTDNFYWCLNPDSGDTGGFLNDDWQTINQRKATLLQKTQPNPTKFTKNGNQICITAGSYPNSKCNA